MIARTALLALLPVVAAFALAQRRRIVAVIGMGVFSLLLSGAYLSLHAPDVAVTEAAIGAALVTFIYVLAIRKTGRLVVVGDEVPGLLEREGTRITGLEYAILSLFARHLGLDLVVRFLPGEDAQEALRRGEADIAGGGVVSSQVSRPFTASPGFLETAFFRIEDPQRPRRSADDGGVYFSDLVEAIRAGNPCAATLDLARFMTVSRLDLSGYRVTRLPGTHHYVFALAEDRSELAQDLQEFLSDLRKSGQLEALVRRYVL